MSLTQDYLTYPQRRHAMDQSLYAWSDPYERAPVAWPNGAYMALWVMPIVQWFPLNMPSKPFRAPGGLTMPFPDFRHYTCRDYGNRVGIFRLLKVLDDLKLPASVAMNAEIALRYPALVKAVVARSMEVVAHGKDMGHVHYTGMADEQALIAQSLAVLRQASGQAVTGWLSPARAQSDQTPHLLAQHGVRYACDWANDDLPYAMNVNSGEHYAMPLAHETDDRVVMLDFHHNEDQWLQQVKDRFDVLYREAQKYGGRVMSVPLHAWVTGVPYRVGKVRELLEYILQHDGIWPATGAQILDAFIASQKVAHG